MKKYLIGVSLLAALAASCSKLDSEGYISEFTPVVDDFVLKSSIDAESGAYIWNDGDVVAVSNGHKVVNFVFSEATGKFTSKTSIERTEDMQAVFPASYAKFESGHFVVDLPAEQVGRLDGSYGVVPMHLWRVRGNVFKFRSFCGVASIALSGSGTALYDAALEKVVFSSAGNPACGKAVLQKDGSLTFSDGVKDLTLVCEEGMHVTNVVNFVLPLHKFPMGSKVSFFFADGKVAESETIMGIMPRSGMVKTYGIEVTADYFGSLEEYENGVDIDDKY